MDDSRKNNLTQQQQTQQKMDITRARNIFNTYQSSFINNLRGILFYKDSIFLATLGGSIYSVSYDTEFTLNKNELTNIINKNPALQEKCKKYLPKYPKAKFEELLSFVNDGINDDNIDIDDILPIITSFSKTINDKEQKRRKVSDGISYTSLILATFSGILTVLSAFKVINVPHWLAIVSIVIVALFAAKLIVERIVNLSKAIKTLNNEDKIKKLSQQTTIASEKLNNKIQSKIISQYKENNSQQHVNSKNAIVHENSISIQPNNLFSLNSNKNLANNNNVLQNNKQQLNKNAENLPYNGNVNNNFILRNNNNTKPQAQNNIQQMKDNIYIKNNQQLDHQMANLNNVSHHKINIQTNDNNLIATKDQKNKFNQNDDDFEQDIYNKNNKHIKNTSSLSIDRLNNKENNNNVDFGKI